ncbi:MAG: hypothetical protein IJ390_09485 [Lachnospiraceae bacterium]|nr:hypothetical protein [Lachnospiraceae bacterium]
MNKSLKRRLKGLVTLWLCLAMMFGASLTAMAQGYCVGCENPNDHGENLIVLTEGTELEDGDELYKMGSGALHVYEPGSDSPVEAETKGSYYVYKKNGEEIWVVDEIVAPYDATVRLSVKAQDTDQGGNENTDQGGNGNTDQGTGTEPEKKTETAGYRCEHDFEYYTTIEPTPENDGEMIYKCKKCNHVDHVMKVSGLGEFFKQVIKKIEQAAPGETVNVSSEIWVCYNKAVFDALAKRPDVALTTNYKYQGKNYTVTIPAGSELGSLLGKDGFCGFRYLDLNFGGTEISE